MRKTNQSLTAAALVALCGSSLMAQIDSGNGRSDASARTAQPAEAAGTKYRGPGLAPTEWIVGQKVLDRDRAKRLGTIKDLILDAEDGHVVYALVNRAPRDDGTPAIVAVPWLALTWDPTERVLTLPVSRDRLAEARVFDAKRWNILNDPTWIDETFGYFSVDPHAYDRGWQEDTATDGAANRDDPTSTPDAHPGTAPPTGDHKDHDDRKPEEVTRGDDRSLATEHPTQYVLASKVKGQTLRGAEDKEIGDVDALVFDPDSGRMAFIVAEFGGFLGIGDSKVAVPWDYFKVNNEGHLYTNEVKADEVRTAPRIEMADWSELRDPRFGPRVYKHFGRDAHWFETGFGGRSSRADLNDQENLFASGTEAEEVGTVSRISDDGAFTTLVITTDAGDRLVHLAPASYLQKSGCTLREGDRVTIHGRTAMIDGKQVLIASSIKGADNKTIDLRDRRGEPKWTDAR